MCISNTFPLCLGLGEADAAEQKQKCFEPFDVRSDMRALIRTGPGARRTLLTVTPGHAVTERTVRTTVLAAMDVVGFCACTGARTRKRLRGAQRHQRAIAR